MRKPLQFTEYQLVHMDALEGAYESLRRFHDKGGDKFYSLTSKGIRFRQYVGTICVGNRQIEVYPKLTDTDDDNQVRWQKLLMHMLRNVYSLNIYTPTDASTKEIRLNVSDMFFLAYLQELEPLLVRGLTRRYRQAEGNLHAMKGKLLFTQHIQRNYVHQERAYVRYQTYDHEHLLNQILLCALRIVLDNSQSNAVKSQARRLSLLAPEIPVPTVIGAEQLNGVRLNRKTDSHRRAFGLAKLILQSMSADIQQGQQPLIALMFDMNRLWEKYVLAMLRRHLPDTHSVNPSNKVFWEGMKYRPWLKPDIVWETECNEVPIIMDTKWKRMKDQGRPSDADLRQIFAYNIYWKATEGYLIYPTINTFGVESGAFMLENHQETKMKCNVLYWPLFDGENPQSIVTTLPSEFTERFQGALRSLH